MFVMSGNRREESVMFERNQLCLWVIRMFEKNQSVYEESMMFVKSSNRSKNQWCLRLSEYLKRIKCPEDRMFERNTDIRAKSGCRRMSDACENQWRLRSYRRKNQSPLWRISDVCEESMSVCDERSPPWRTVTFVKNSDVCEERSRWFSITFYFFPVITTFPKYFGLITNVTVLLKSHCSSLSSLFLSNITVFSNGHWFSTNILTLFSHHCSFKCHYSLSVVTVFSGHRYS